MNRNFGRFKNVGYEMGGVVSPYAEEPVEEELPTIMGPSFPDSGMKSNTLGEVNRKKKTPPPKLYAEQIASRKRMKKGPSSLPPGPPTGGEVPSGPSPQEQPGQSAGDDWMGEIWQQLSPDQMVQGQGPRGELSNYPNPNNPYTPPTIGGGPITGLMGPELQQPRPLGGLSNYPNPANTGGSVFTERGGLSNYPNPANDGGSVFTERGGLSNYPNPNNSRQRRPENGRRRGGRRGGGHRQRPVAPSGGLGYAGGGSVDSLMSVYNQTIADLESGGIGYADGGAVAQSREIASMGRGGDSMLMHINPAELDGLQSLLGPVSVNPDTGNPEALAWLLPLVMAGFGAVSGGVMSDWEAGPMIMGGLAGLTMGAGMGAGAAVPAITATGASASSAPVLGSLPAVLGGGPIGGALAPGAGVLASGAGGGTLATSLAPGAGVFAPAFGGGTLAGSLTPAQLTAGVPGTMASANAGGLSSILGNIDGMDALKSGLGVLQQSGQPEQPAQMPAPTMPGPPARFAENKTIYRPPRIGRPSAGGAGRIKNVLNA